MTGVKKLVTGVAQVASIAAHAPETPGEALTHPHIVTLKPPGPTRYLWVSQPHEAIQRPRPAGMRVLCANS
jgi:hypothetical protein